MFKWIRTENKINKVCLHFTIKRNDIRRFFLHFVIHFYNLSLEIILFSIYK